MTNGFERKKEAGPQGTDFSQIDPRFLEQSKQWGINDYDAIAAIYDEAMGQDIAELIFPVHKAILENEFDLQQKHQYLDVCCGTGSYLRELSRAVSADSILIGLDISEGQVGMARQKSEQSKNISYIVGDAVAADFPSGCDVITMNLDTMNHLRTPEDWQTVQRKIFAALKTDGLFLFDINTQQRLGRDLNFPEIIVKPDLTHIDFGVSVETVGDFTRQNHLMRAFKRQPDGSWKEYHANIQHIAPTEEKLYQMLGEAGFATAQEILIPEETRKKHIFLKNRLFIKARK